MNESTMNKLNTGFKFRELSDEQINEVAGGFAPALWGLGIGAYAVGLQVGNMIWGD